MKNSVYKTIELRKGIPAPYTFVADNTLRAIDLVCRTFCKHGDKMLSLEPTRSDYRYVAKVNHIDYVEVALDEKLSITADALLKLCHKKTRLIWLCCPNVVTGTTVAREEIVKLLQTFKGMVVVDEVLGDYARQRSMRYELPKHANLVILNEPGIIFTQPDNIALLSQLAPLYATEKDKLDDLDDPYDAERSVTLTLQERDRMMDAFRALPFCTRVYPSEAPFFVVALSQSDAVISFLATRQLSLKPLEGIPHHFVITVGKRAENNELIGALRQYE